ncbi:MAG: TonB-dependent receptor plug domain-containing protein, partial [Flavobacteriaceae bacterium]|nr:TonB-dependent receptor plug domain-containing protein [Flavobacteriaceae bacterium]
MMKKNSNNLLSILFLVSSILLFTSFSSRDISLNKQQSNNPYFNTNPITEKVYLHLDKPYYTSGEDIWFKVYLVDANTLQSNALSKIVYVDLINPNNEIIDTRSITINKGGGNGEFRLSNNLISGQYYIRAYTNFMRNYDNKYFFKKNIYVYSLNSGKIEKENYSSIEAVEKKSKEKIDVQFFPEGGDMLNAFPNRLGFKAIDLNGKGIPIEGTILEENGKEIIKFKTSKFGLGRLIFTPENNKIYKAHINYNKQDYYYDLPKALNNGVSMKVVDIDNHYQIIVQSSLNEGVNNLILIGQQNEKVVGRAKIIGFEKISTINIPKTIFKQGIVQFTVLDKNEKPWCERLVFVENEKEQPKINITLSKNEYQKRELVEIDLSLNKKVIKADQTNMSISITDMLVVKPNNYGLDIKSYLLLESDLRGEVESPGYYFISNDPQRKEVLDILMMTQGWRRFSHNTPIDNPFKYKLEKGISFKGNVKNIDTHEKISSEVTLLLKNKGVSFSDSIQTINQGYFTFGDYNIVDSTTIIIKVLSNNEKPNKKQKKLKMNYFIEFDKYTPPKVIMKSTSVNTTNKESKKQYIKRSKAIQLEGIYQNGNNSVQLDEVTLDPISRKKIDVYDIKKKKIGIKHMEASHTVSSKQLKHAAPGNLMDVLKSRIPGLIVQGNEILLRGRTTFLVAGSEFREPEKPLFVLDNMVTDFEAIRYLQADEIDFVEVLKGSRAAIYGSLANHGVIAIYTKSATEKYNIPITEETFV